MTPINPERNVRAEDLLTAASAVTTANLGLSTYGATHLDTLKGFVAFTLARVGDKADGWLARKMNQESDAGAIYDTVVDKVGIGLAAIHCWQKEIIPRPAIAAIGARSLASVVLTAAMAHNHPDESFRPTTAGKIAMGAESVTFMAYAGAKLLENTRPELITQQKIVRGIGHAAIATTVATGAVALAQYAKRAFAHEPSTP
ncbi:MAG: CDP-alcohol phosphatidyltransferase family protein [Candidatus Saccharimonadales bacterium]